MGVGFGVNPEKQAGLGGKPQAGIELSLSVFFFSMKILIFIENSASVGNKKVWFLYVFGSYPAITLSDHSAFRFAGGIVTTVDRTPERSSLFDGAKN